MNQTTMNGLDAKHAGLARTSTDVLHHIGLVNKDIAASAAVYEKLGFTLTPVSTPKVVLEPGGEPETLGVANRHIILAYNFLELLGIADAGKWASVRKDNIGPYNLDIALNRYEGLHIMHFGTNHIDVVKERLDYQGVLCSEVKNFQRNVQTEDGERTMRARTIAFPPNFNPEGLLQIAQHDTPELVFQPRYMHHRNGAIALTEILIVADTPAIYASKYELYSGHSGSEIGIGHYEVDLGHSKITIVDPERLDNIFPCYKIPAVPFMAAFTIRVASLRHLCNVLSGNEVPFIKIAGSVMVYPEEACGCAIVFEE